MMQSSDLGDKGMSHSPRKNKAEALALKSIFYQQVTLSRIFFMLIYRQSAQYSGVLLSSHHCLHSTLVYRIDVQDEINMQDRIDVQGGNFLENQLMCRGKFLRAGENKHADNGRIVLPLSTTPKKQYVFEHCFFDRKYSKKCKNNNYSKYI